MLTVPKGCSDPRLADHHSPGKVTLVVVGCPRTPDLLVAKRAPCAYLGEAENHEAARLADLVELRGFQPLTFSSRRPRRLVRGGLPRCIRCDCCGPHTFRGYAGVRDIGPPA